MAKQINSSAASLLAPEFLRPEVCFENKKRNRSKHRFRMRNAKTFSNTFNTFSLRRRVKTSTKVSACHKKVIKRYPKSTNHKIRIQQKYSPRMMQTLCQSRNAICLMRDEKTSKANLCGCWMGMSEKSWRMEESRREGGSF